MSIARGSIRPQEVTDDQHRSRASSSQRNLHVISYITKRRHIYQMLVIPRSLTMHIHSLHPARHARDTPSRCSSVTLPLRLSMSRLSLPLRRRFSTVLGGVWRGAIRRLRHSILHLPMLLALGLRLRSVVRIPRRTMFGFHIIACPEARCAGVGVVPLRSGRRREVRCTGGGSV